jgi:hypothetical protein
MARKAPVLPAKANAKAKAQMAPKALGMNSKNPMPAMMSKGGMAKAGYAKGGAAKKSTAMAKGGMAKKGKK